MKKAELLFLTFKRIGLCCMDYMNVLELRRWLIGKESTCQWRRHRFNPWARKVLWRRKGQPTPIFLPVKSHGHSPQNLKESDACCSVTEQQQQSYSQSSFELDSILSCFLNSSAKYAACSELNYHFIITLTETWPSSFSPFWGVDGNLFNNPSNNLRAT